MKKAINDLIYGFAVWIVMRYNKLNAAELLRHWANNLERNYLGRK